jgi:hypothetical protein
MCTNKFFNHGRKNTEEYAVRICSPRYFIRLRQEAHWRPQVQDQPVQHSDTCLKKKYLGINLTRAVIELDADEVN